VTGRAVNPKRDEVHSPLARLLSVKDLAEILQVPPKTIYAWRYHGKGPRAVPVGKYVRFRAEDVAAWLEMHAEPPREQSGLAVARSCVRTRSARRARGASSLFERRRTRLGNAPG
jgi:excisionase family DNA binding protein